MKILKPFNCELRAFRLVQFPPEKQNFAEGPQACYRWLVFTLAGLKTKLKGLKGFKALNSQLSGLRGWYNHSTIALYYPLTGFRLRAVEGGSTMGYNVYRLVPLYYPPPAVAPTNGVRKEKQNG